MLYAREPPFFGLVYPTSTPDTYNYLTFTDAQLARTPMSFAPGSRWPANMSGRDVFRVPGWWNLDLGVYKDTKITERVSPFSFGERFSIYSITRITGASADVGSGNAVTACYGCAGSTLDRRHLQLGAKIIF
jgi:hypothetical protein